MTNNTISDLETYFNNNTGKLIHKWNHYFDIYERHFKKYRNKEVVILEIGVSQGGSLQMWKDYFGNEAKIYGIDIDPRCKALEEDNVKIFIGSQSDRKFLNEVKKAIPLVDILIDDGGHTMEQLRISFEELFDHVKSDGVYLAEDLHTCYWLPFGGGYKRQNTFIEYSKNFIDYLNAYHSKQKSLRVNSFTKTVDSLHYYDSILVIEKRIKSEPFHEQTGKASFNYADSKEKNISKRELNRNKIKKKILIKINKGLRFFRLPGFIWK